MLACEPKQSSMPDQALNLISTRRPQAEPQLRRREVPLDRRRPSASEINSVAGVRSLEAERTRHECLHHKWRIGRFRPPGVLREQSLPLCLATALNAE